MTKQQKKRLIDGGSSIESLRPKVNKEKKSKMFKTAINLLKNLNIEAMDIDYGYDIDYDGNKYGDGSFTITITGKDEKI